MIAALLRRLGLPRHTPSQPLSDALLVIEQQNAILAAHQAGFEAGRDYERDLLWIQGVHADHAKTAKKRGESAEEWAEEWIGL